jgi:CRP/FNR family transcriptional regulator, cyclic AMP receptor protein
MNELPPAPQGPTIDLFEVDHDIAHAVPPEDRAEAERMLVVPARTVARDEPVLPERDGPFAQLLVSGALWREVSVGTSVFPQLLHPGAVLLCAPPPGELLESSARAAALTPATLAVLDERFVAATMRWPRLAAVLHRRLAEQERDLAVYAAIAGLSRVDDRLLLLLWHLAERWGRVVPEGVRVSLRLTHATLGRFVGARRPNVSLAVSELRERGELERAADGGWVLTGQSPKAAGLGAPAHAPSALPDLFGPATRLDAA